MWRGDTPSHVLLRHLDLLPSPIHFRKILDTPLPCIFCHPYYQYHHSHSFLNNHLLATNYHLRRENSSIVLPRNKGVSSSVESRWFTSAPCFRSSFTQPLWPAVAASISAVSPSDHCQFTQTSPTARNTRTVKPRSH